MGTTDMDIIILSRSSKHGKYCVAGIHLQTGDFVRLCSEDESTHGALSETDLEYDDRSSCAILDVARIYVKGNKPLPTQPENIVIDQSRRWHKLGRYAVNDLDIYLTKEPRGLVYGSTSPIATLEQVIRGGKSLLLVKAKDILFYKTINTYGSRKSKVDFTINGTFHKEYSMTDPRFYYIQDGTTISSAILLISVPEDSSFYKFVATIITV